MNEELYKSMRKQIVSISLITDIDKKKLKNDGSDSGNANIKIVKKGRRITQAVLAHNNRALRYPTANVKGTYWAAATQRVDSFIKRKAYAKIGGQYYVDVMHLQAIKDIYNKTDAELVDYYQLEKSSPFIFGLNILPFPAVFQNQYKDIDLTQEVNRICHMIAQEVDFSLVDVKISNMENLLKKVKNQTNNERRRLAVKGRILSSFYSTMQELEAWLNIVEDAEVKTQLEKMKRIKEDIHKTQKEIFG